MWSRKSVATALNLFFLLVAWPLPVLDSLAQASETDDSAMALVEERHLGESLGWLGYQAASRTVTFGSIVKTLGKTQAQTLVKDQLQRVQPDFQARWDSNLAASYAQYFTVDELRALNSGNSPPMLANKVKAKQSEVSTDMKLRSSDLLREFVAKALNNALATLAH